MAAILCARRQCRLPHALIGQPVGAHNGQLRVLAPQLVHFDKARRLQVNDGHIGVSILPSAVTSSLRQELEGCTPSSKSARAFSSGSSPFSRSLTIFSSRSRQSSNLGKRDSSAHFSLNARRAS